MPNSLGDFEAAVRLRSGQMQDQQVVQRIWRKDHTVWKPDPKEISNRLGWLNVAETMAKYSAELNDFVSEIRDQGFCHAVLLGMGGSSLAPQVFADVFSANQDQVAGLTVLDTTHPATIAHLDESLDFDKTLFIVASKSGGTIETLSHFSHYYDKAGRGDHFVAITDSGSALESIGAEHKFRRVFLNPEDIGGRYAALSLFGLVPAALIGVDVEAVCEGAGHMGQACLESTHPLENPGAWLGTVIGEAALAGRDKLTLALPPRLASFGDWVEQLIAESTGKQGRGILPVVGEDLGPPEAYGSDRLFISVGEGSAMLDQLESAGHPVIRLSEDFALNSAESDLGAEYFRFEFAAAVAGYVLAINPFDQPNVAEAKLATAEILEGGSLESTGFDDPGLLLDAIEPGDYVAIQAYLDRTPETTQILQSCRLAIRDRYRVATTTGFGPRFLHSTGQLHKGGPDSGVFLQLIDEARSVDVPVPGYPFSFGRLIDAQALGDLRSLKSRGRRVVRTTLAALAEALQV